MMWVPSAVIAETLMAIHESGRHDQEGIVIWLGRRSGEDVNVVEPHHPIHDAKSNMFLIPSAGMRKLQERMRDTRTFVAAQVHSHPEEAFHSEEDVRWAIVRHAGALSAVLPRFGLRITPSSFLEKAKLFRLNEASTWQEVLGQEAARTWSQI
jgi:proteasome lid subunit RPN8/RPN11